MSKVNYAKLYPFAYLSILTAVITISLKTCAYLLTGSIGLLSDAMESIVNLVAAVIALLMLRLAAKPPDSDHAYGHTKAEYFSSITEGTLIIVAALGIIWAAYERLRFPQPLSQPFLGMAMSALAALINGGVAIVLINNGRKYRSITLEADGKHLLTDVWTSGGVLLTIMLISITKINLLDPLVAILVAGNIILAGGGLIKKSLFGFMDTTISLSDLELVKKVMSKFERQGITFHGLRTRQSGMRKFMSVHILLPGNWTTQKAHDLSEKFESEIRKQIENITISTHLEPKEDKKSWQDIELDR